MLQAEYLRHHVEALLRLSRDAEEPALSAKLREMADEFRIMVSVADVSDLAAALNRNAPPLAPDLIGTGAARGRTADVEN
jgi:hypothetical protein